MYPIAYHAFGMKEDAAGSAAATKIIKDAVKTLNGQLDGKAWLVGDDQVRREPTRSKSVDDLLVVAQYLRKRRNTPRSWPRFCTRKEWEPGGL